MSKLYLIKELEAAAARQPSLNKETNAAPSPLSTKGTSVNLSFGNPPLSFFADTTRSTRVRLAATGDVRPLEETRLAARESAGDLVAEVAFRRREVGLERPPRSPVIYHFDPKFRSVSEKLTVKGRGQNPDVSAYRNQQQNGTVFESVIVDFKKLNSEPTGQLELGESTPRKGPTVDSLKATERLTKDLEISEVFNETHGKIDGLGITLLGRF